VNLSADALRERFAVHGRFYEATLDGRSFALRSHLELFESHLGWRDAVAADADLVAVMMNPGASRPLAEPDAEGWAPAVPDRTQYQLMKLALHAQQRGWALRHIRVLNLSDLRTPKSAALFETLATLADDRHSIFSPRRRGELHKALGAAATPVLRAWGMSPQLKPLVALAIPALGANRVLGLTDNEIQYRHPLPQRADFQLRWLADMCAQVDALVAV
jgi:hypothetical protein